MNRRTAPTLQPELGHDRADNDVEMDGRPVKDGDMDQRCQPALPPEKANLCQYQELPRLLIIFLACVLFGMSGKCFDVTSDFPTLFGVKSFWGTMKAKTFFDSKLQIDLANAIAKGIRSRADETAYKELIGELIKRGLLDKAP